MRLPRRFAPRNDRRERRLPRSLSLARNDMKEKQQGKLPAVKACDIEMLQHRII